MIVNNSASPNKLNRRPKIIKRRGIENANICVNNGINKNIVVRLFSFFILTSANGIQKTQRREYAI
jgi:hypothetical protein